MRATKLWTVASRLRLLSIMIVLSGIVGIVGALEISKCAKMHEFNSLHLKHNYLFSNEVIAFHDRRDRNVDGIREQLLLIREQPIDCLALLGPMERAVVYLAGTYRTVEICDGDITLANQTLQALDEFEASKRPRTRLMVALREAEKGFNQNSVEFEPLVENTVNAVSTVVIVLVVFKALFVGVCGWLMSKSVGKDYDKLRKAEESLERTHNELQNFVYRTSHDFKSPLLGIKSMTRFIKEDVQSGDTDEAIANVQRIQKNIDELEQVVEKTLQLAKSDLSTNRFDPVTVGELLGEMSSRLEAYARERNVHIEIEDHTGNRLIVTDRNHLLAAIENLVGNGIKYSSDQREDSFVAVEVSICQEHYLRIVVADNGIGIPTPYQADAFEMFKQFHPERSNGTGLGMYIVKRSVERLQGQVSLESSHQGTSVMIAIPLAA